MDPEQNPMSRDPNPQIVESLQPDVGPKKTMGIVGPTPRMVIKGSIARKAIMRRGSRSLFPEYWRAKARKAVGTRMIPKYFIEAQKLLLARLTTTSSRAYPNDHTVTPNIITKNDFALGEFRRFQAKIAMIAERGVAATTIRMINRFACQDISVIPKSLLFLSGYAKIQSNNRLFSANT